MAKTRVTTVVQTETAKANVSNRQRCIVDSFKEMYGLDREIDAMTERHLKGLRERKSELKARLRDDFGMPAKLVNCRYAAYRLERAASEGGDNITLDVIKEMFEILPVGQSVNFLDALDAAGESGQSGAAVNEDGTPTADGDGFVSSGGDEAKAYQIGYAAGLAGETLDATRYKGHGLKNLRVAFEKGHIDGQAEIISKKPASAGSQTLQ
jgi:hypothetical protein